MELSSYLGCRNSPHLEVVWSHEKVSNTDTHLTQNPLVKVGGFGVGDTRFQSSINHALNAANLFMLGKHGDIVLERIRNPLALATNVGDTLVSVPVVRLGKSFINAVIKVFVVREDNVTANVVQLSSVR